MQVIRITILKLDLSDNDAVYVIDGETDSFQQKDTLNSNFLKYRNYTLSVTNIVYVEFKSDASKTAGGFKIKYVTEDTSKCLM